MAHIATGTADIQYDSLALIPLGGQNELGQLLWILTFGGEMLLIDAGAAYPAEDLPGVDLLFPNTNFLEANQERILALLLTNGHEEHCGAVNYLLRHLSIPKIMAPRFVSQLLSQSNLSSPTETAEVTQLSKVLDTIKVRESYQIGPFQVEWMNVNNAIADACALRVSTPEGAVVYTSSFKLDQTPVDKRFLDINGLAGSGDKGVLVLISDSAGVENKGYTPSEISVKSELIKHVENAIGRVIVVFPGTNTHRLQILFDVAQSTGRKIILSGESLVATALSAVVTGNLVYDRQIETTVEDLGKLSDQNVLILASGIEVEPLNVLHELAHGKNDDFKLKEGDTVIYSANIVPGKLRYWAKVLDQLLSLGVKTIHGGSNIHVSKHASREELKLMLSMTRPRYFVPAIGEGRHVMHHAQLAIDWGLDPDNVFPINNGDILEVKNGVASIIGTIESQAVLYNREQGERVTTFSVQERRALSMEGVVTVSLAVNQNGDIVSGPSISAGASGFIKSREWFETCDDVIQLIRDTVAKFAERPKGKALEIGALRTSLRELVMKTLRSKIQAKPTVQVVVHDLDKLC
ncbi:MAG: ribonuclease J [Candidatus Obscuribacterales bacterium]|nr:ribonuclease J [Candidatus Obscuribacterales bacterium]